MSNAPSRSNFESVVAKAIQCRSCFSDLPVEPALVNIAQPRWVGPGYWDSNPRVAIVMLHPGSGEGRSDAGDDDSPDRRMLSLLRALAAGKGSLADVFRHQADDSPNWGHGRFLRFYIEGLNLRFENVAFANIAWCATRGNQCSSAMLQRCFDLHTAELLRALAPNVVLLSGTGTHSFTSRIQRILPEAQIVPMLHYAHRKGKEAEAFELERVRRMLG